MRSNERSSTIERELSQTAASGRHVVGKEVHNTTILNMATRYPTEGCKEAYLTSLHHSPYLAQLQRGAKETREVESGVTRPDLWGGNMVREPYIRNASSGHVARRMLGNRMWEMRYYTGGCWVGGYYRGGC